MARIHHAAICTRDLEASLRFWRDGLGFEVLIDQDFRGDWPTLFRAPTDSLHSVFLGRSGDFDSGIVELVVFDGMPDAVPDDAVPRPGFFLLSAFAPPAATFARLHELEVGSDARTTVVDGVEIGVIRDPNGVLVELIDPGASANLDRLGDRA